MAYLVGHESTDYVTIKQLFNLSDGHMTTHMRELINNDYVSVEKLFENDKPRTIYHITEIGRSAFEEYVEALKTIISF